MSADGASACADVVIENCRSIDCASVFIEPGKLNVKFAPNDTGKLSIAEALPAAVNGSDGFCLAPKWLQEGSTALLLCRRAFSWL